MLRVGLNLGLKHKRLHETLKNSLKMSQVSKPSSEQDKMAVKIKNIRLTKCQIKMNLPATHPPLLNSLKIVLDTREIGSNLAFKIFALDGFKNFMNSLKISLVKTLKNSFKIGLDTREIGSNLAFKIRALDNFKNLMNSLQISLMKSSASANLK